MINIKILSVLFAICCIFTNISAQETNQVTDVRELKGVVKDELGLPFVGVTVMQKGTTVGSTTDVNGNFSFTVNSTSSPLIFSFIGYETQEIPIDGRSYFDVVLNTSAMEVDAVTVVAYGVQRKETLTGAISAVDTDDLLRTPNASIGNSLSGQISGVSTVSSSGQPGADDPDIYIRGSGTLNDEAAAPLILVDGIEMSFFQMDPNEIKSISVLKDASATAVFGVRGANGVILVTTRRGTKGRPKISLTSSVGISRPIRITETADSYTYARLYNEMGVNDGKSIGNLTFSPHALEMFKTNADPIMYPNTDWNEYMFRDISMQTQHNVNISGGTETVRYFTSIGYLYQDGLFKDLPDLDYDNNFKYQRYNFRANLDIDITKTTLLKINIGGILGQTSEPIGGENGIWRTLNMSLPFSSPGIIDGRAVENDGSYFGDMSMASGLTALYGTGYTSKSKNTMNMNLELNQELDVITKGLSFGIKGAYNTNYTFTKKRSTSREIWNPFYASSIDGSGLEPGDEGFDNTVVYRIKDRDGNLGYAETTGKGRDWYLEASLRYSRKFGDHNVGGLVLYNQSKKYYPTQYVSSPSAYVGLVGRVTYDYKRKYLAEFNIGYNGSENFAPESRYGLFPAVSLGWVISREDFLKNSKVISFLKLRASVGLVGNDNMSNNRFLYLADSYTMNGGGYNFGVDIPENQLSAVEKRIGNPFVTWETALKQNYGIDARLFDDQFSVSVDYFREIRKDILINRKTVPSIIDLGSAILPVINLGEVHNQGFEVSLSWKQYFKDFSYWINTNASFARNKIIYMDEVTPAESYMAQTGLPTGLNYGYVAEGYYDYDDFEDYKTGILKEGYADPGVAVYPGDVIYKDLNADGVINTDDQTYSGSPKRPEIVFGINFGVSYKGFDLSMNWAGSGLRSVLLEDIFRQPFGTTGNRALMLYMADERWTPENSDNAQAPRFSQDSREYNYRNSSLWIRSAAYLRLKNIKLGYTFNDSKLLAKVGISRLQMYVNCYNTLTFDELLYIDPEYKPGKDGTYPITQIYNFGVSINF